MIPVTFDEEMLTEAALNEYEMFLDQGFDDAGCSCHISPPCPFCTHPGNPLNLMEDDSAWRDKKYDEDKLMDSIRRAAGGR